MGVTTAAISASNCLSGESVTFGVVLGAAAASAMAGNAGRAVNAGHSGSPEMTIMALTMSVCVSV